VYTDGNFGIVDLITCVKQLATVEVVLQPSVPYNSQHLAEGEQIHFQIAAQFRTLRKELEDSLHHAIESGMAINDWLLRHCGWCRTRFGCTGSGGDTPYHRLNGVRYSAPTYQVGRVVLASGNADLQEGIWLGKSELDDSHIVATPDGRIVLCRNISSFSDDESYDLEFLQGIVHTPVNFQGDIGHNGSRDMTRDGSIHVTDSLPSASSAVNSVGAAALSSIPAAPLIPQTVSVPVPAVHRTWQNIYDSPTAEELEPQEGDTMSLYQEAEARITASRLPDSDEDEMQCHETIQDGHWERPSCLVKEMFDESELILVHKRDKEVLGKFNAHEWVILELQERKWISLRWDSVREPSGELRSCWQPYGLTTTAGDDDLPSPTLTVEPTEIIHLYALEAHHSLVYSNPLYLDPDRAISHGEEMSRLYSETSQTRWHVDQYRNGQDEWNATIKVHIDGSTIEVFSDRTEKCIQLLSSFSLLKVAGPFEPWPDGLTSVPYLGRRWYYFDNIIFKKIDLKDVVDDLYNSEVVTKALVRGISTPSGDNECFQSLVEFLCGRKGETRALTIDPSSHDGSISVDDNNLGAITMRSTDGIISFPSGVIIQNNVKAQTLLALSSGGTQLRDTLIGRIQSLHVQGLCAEAPRQSRPVITYMYPLADPTTANPSGNGCPGDLAPSELFVQHLSATGGLAVRQAYDTANTADIDTQISNEGA